MFSMSRTSIKSLQNIQLFCDLKILIDFIPYVVAGFRNWLIKNILNRLECYLWPNFIIDDPRNAFANVISGSCYDFNSFLVKTLIFEVVLKSNWSQDTITWAFSENEVHILNYFVRYFDRLNFVI